MSYYVVNPFTGQFDDAGSSPASTVLGPGSSTVGNIATWNNTTGTLLADSGVAISTDVTLSANSDTLVSTQKAVKTYVDAATSGITFEAPVYAATTGALTAAYANGAAGVGATLTNSGALAAFSTDGVSPPINSRILVKNQAATLQNGVYTLTTVGSGAVAWVLTRATDYDQPSEIVPGTMFIVLNGTTLVNSGWLETATVTAVGTDPIVFAQNIYSPTLFLQVANNLSDLNNAVTARSNLGLTDIAIQAVTQYDVLVGGAGNTITSVGPGSVGQVLQSGGAAADPSYSTATYPLTTTANQLLYSTAANTIGELASAANGVLITSAGSVPSISSTLPSVVQGNITSLGTIVTGVWNGTAIAVANGGTGATSAVNARTNLGLGTADSVTFALFNVTSTNTGTITTITSSNNTATGGPDLDLFRNSSSPDVGDDMGSLLFTGRSSTGVKREYAKIEATIISPTNAAESCDLSFYTISSGSLIKQIDMLATGSQYRGNNTNTAPPAGFIGEEIRTAVASGAAIAISTGSVVTIASITLTPGVWDCNFVCRFTGGAITGTYCIAGIATATNSTTGWVDGDSATGTPTMPTAAIDSVLTIPQYRILVSANTTYYMTASSAYTVGSISAYGRFSAVRVG